MNKTISIYLQETGSNALIDIPCRLYKGSYKDKQINVYVPKSLLFEAEDTSLVNTINIGAILTAENGTQTTTVPYYPNYVQDEIVNGVEYAVYSLSMPNTFTAFVGTQTIVVNVVNIDNTDALNPVVLEITTTQTVELVINQSANISQEEVIEADQVTLINAELQDIQTTLAGKQNIQDATLQTTSKTVPGSINEINNLANSSASTIETQGQSITQLQTDVAELQAKMAGAEIPVGEISGESLPTNAQLDAYVLSETGSAPQPNNVIIFTLIVPNGTDRVYKYIYVSPEYGWADYEIPALEHARNGTFGSVEGTYGIDSQNETLVNIVDGEIKDIYYKDNNNNYSNVRDALNTIKQVQDDIIDGTQVVAQSTRAIQDQLGNVINTTYAEASQVYTKTQSDEKYLSKTYTNIYYYATDGLVDDVPTTPASGIQFTQVVDTIGETEICSCDRTTTGDYHFTKNSSDTSSIVLATDVNCSLQFRLETYANETILAADLSDVMQFTANTPQTLDITTIYSDLGTQEIDVPTGSTITKVLYAISTDTTAKTVYLYSNTTYPSTYQLNAQSIVLTLNTINGLKSVNIASTDWTDNGDDTYTVVIPQVEHQQPASTKYILELQKQVTANSYQYIAFTPIVADSGDITITTNEAIDCVLLIGSSLATDERAIFYVTNPTVAQEIDYNQYGAMKVTQTTTPVALTLVAPTDVSKFYAFFITNDGNSTETINWNGEDIAPGSGLQFRWDGAQWIVGEQPTSTAEIYDDANDQLLSTTLNQMQDAIANNTSDITTLGSTKADTSALADYVPTTRTINSQALTSDITLTASDVGAYTTTETDDAISTAISGKEDVSNKVTSISSSSTDTEYPSAKCVYDELANKQGNITVSVTGNGNAITSASLEANNTLSLTKDDTFLTSHQSHYMHMIKFYSGGMYFTTCIINTSQTQFNKTTFTNWLYNNGFRESVDLSGQTSADTSQGRYMASGKDANNNVISSVASGAQGILNYFTSSTTGTPLIVSAITVTFVDVVIEI